MPTKTRSLLPGAIPPGSFDAPLPRLTPRQKPRGGLGYLVLLAPLVLSVLAAVSFGTMTIPIGDVYRVILHELFGLGDPAAWGSGGVHDVVWLIRLPRLTLAIGVGRGLSVWGVVMQASVKNPLADPYVLGVSSGASLGAAIAILAGSPN